MAIKLDCRTIGGTCYVSSVDLAAVLRARAHRVTHQGDSPTDVTPE